MSNPTEIKVNYNNVAKQITDKRIAAIINIIFRYYEGKQVTDHRGDTRTIRTRDDIEDFYGLPYTSSGAFAGVWNTNTETEFVEGQFVQGFAMTFDHMVFVITHDCEENEKWYLVGFLMETMSDVREFNTDEEHHFFSRESMRFFSSKIESALYAGRWFITSEKKGFTSSDRGYTVREVRLDASIKTVGSMNDHWNIESAREAVRELVKGAK